MSSFLSSRRRFGIQLYPRMTGRIIEPSLRSIVHERYLENSKIWGALPRVPKGFTSLEDFFSGLGRNLEQEIYFALKLMPKPLDNCFSYLEATAFGVLTPRADGKLGRLCFADFSTDFLGLTFATCDGFDANTLQLDWDGYVVPNSIIKEEGATSKLHIYMYRHCRILAIYTKKAEVQKIIAESILERLRVSLGRSKTPAGNIQQLLALKESLGMLFPTRDVSFVGEELHKALSTVDSALEREALWEELLTTEANAERLRKAIKNFTIEDSDS